MYDALFWSLDVAMPSLCWFSALLPAMQVNKDRIPDMAGSYWAQATQ
ncbi:hypothetical protein OPKNFCMD_6907 [Methylobacterium crusticola]|uniref:Uncharacterized protein n=1 Tax=Methylobacterium crusticola TaxID=1697972 RepID=A0ABQ4R9N6_9HYPH|nr:hypothetical protein OPKNFCMD_6907 [Methylobacterium crusticola]